VFARASALYRNHQRVFHPFQALAQAWIPKQALSLGASALRFYTTQVQALALFPKLSPPLQAFCPSERLQGCAPPTTKPEATNA
jgi:hypothetical protein